MQAKLFCKTGPLAGASFGFENEATIGKNPGNTIQLTPGVISGKHARIYFDQQRGAFFVEDLRSRNGTWVDGVRLQRRERLDKLSVITFAGSFDFIFHVLEPGVVAGREAVVSRNESAGSPSKQARGTVFDNESPPAPILQLERNVKESARAQAAPQSGGGSAPTNATQFEDQGVVPPAVLPVSNQERKVERAKQYSLTVKVSGGKPDTFILKEGDNVVGRERSCDIFISDASASRRHAVITVRSGKVTVKDLSSKNRTSVNNRIINEETAVAAGDEIGFGVIVALLVERK